MTIIMAAHRWSNNAELIADVARLGYILQTDKVLDPTYGRGKWWTVFRPDDLTMHDRDAGPAKDGVDFRDLPHADNSFDVVAFDPPYVSKGGRKTTTMPDFQDRYGMGDAPTSPAGVQILMNDGLNEANRVTKPGGYILMKSQDYISSGKLWTGTFWTESHARLIGLIPVERFEHIGNGSAQSKDRRQVHARRNLSTLFIFQKAKTKKGTK